MTNAAVLPVPVRAWASTSTPSSARGNQAGLHGRGLEILGLGQGLEHHGRKRKFVEARSGLLGIARIRCGGWSFSERFSASLPFMNSADGDCRRLRSRFRHEHLRNSFWNLQLAMLCFP